MRCDFSEWLNRHRTWSAAKSAQQRRSVVDRHKSHTRGTSHSRPFSWATRSLRGALGVASRPSLFDGRRFDVDWHFLAKIYRHSHFLIPRFLARTPLDHSLPIYARAVARQAAWRPHALPRPSCAFQPAVETLSELLPNAPSSSYVPLRPSHISSISHPFRKN